MDYAAAGEDGRNRWGGPAAQGLDAGDQFGEGERLGQVVVRAETEPIDAICDRVGCGQHEHAGVAAVVGESAADLVPVDAR